MDNSFPIRGENLPPIYDGVSPDILETAPEWFLTENPYIPLVRFH